MKLVYHLLVISVVTILGCGQKSSVPDSNEWSRFQSPDAPYSVLMPGKPVREEEQDEDGVVATHTCKYGEEFAVITGSSNLSSDFDVSNKKKVSDALDKGLASAVEVFEGEVLDKKNLIIDRLYPARDCKIKVAASKTQNIIVHLRFVLTPDKLIHVMVFANETESSNPQIKKCLDSLKIKLEVE
jgi:hypothetical protein